jgi:prepilin-type N-terminal cleavage/methylation domain-containing protein
MNPAGKFKVSQNIGCGGMTLVEVLIALALSVLLCAGLFKVGLKTAVFGEDNRVATEARFYAKERLEEILATGRGNLSDSCTLLLSDTNLSTRGYPIVRIPRIVWHTADKSITGTSNAIYGEVHVDVRYWSPLSSTTVTDSFSTIIQ